MIINATLPGDVFVAACVVVVVSIILCVVGGPVVAVDVSVGACVVVVVVKTVDVGVCVVAAASFRDNRLKIQSLNIKMLLNKL